MSYKPFWRGVNSVKKFRKWFLLGCCCFFPTSEMINPNYLRDFLLLKLQNLNSQPNQTFALISKHTVQRFILALHPIAQGNRWCLKPIFFYWQMLKSFLFCKMSFSYLLSFTKKHIFSVYPRFLRPSCQTFSLWWVLTSFVRGKKTFFFCLILDCRKLYWRKTIILYAKQMLH